MTWGNFIETFKHIGRAWEIKQLLLSINSLKSKISRVYDIMLLTPSVSAWCHDTSTSVRSSPPEVFLDKGVPKKCSKFTGEHPCRSEISIKLLCNFIEITLRHGCSPVNLLHIFRKPFYKNIYVGMLRVFHLYQLAYLNY